MRLNLEETVKGITPVSDAWRRKAREHLNNLTIPVGSLGRLLESPNNWLPLRKA